MKWRTANHRKRLKAANNRVLYWYKSKGDKIYRDLKPHTAFRNRRGYYKQYVEVQ